jgi:hypothetical protein
VTLKPPHCQFGLSPQAQPGRLRFSPLKLQILQRVSLSFSHSLTFQEFQPSKSFPLPSSFVFSSSSLPPSSQSSHDRGNFTPLPPVAIAWGLSHGFGAEKLKEKICLTHVIDNQLLFGLGSTPSSGLVSTVNRDRKKRRANKNHLLPNTSAILFLQSVMGMCPA